MRWLLVLLLTGFVTGCPTPPVASPTRTELLARAKPQEGLLIEGDYRFRDAARVERLRIDGHRLGWVLGFDSDHQLTKVCEATRPRACRRVDRVIRSRSDPGSRRALDSDDRTVAEYHIRGGQLDGAFSLTDASGARVLTGSYRAGQRHARWDEKTSNETVRAHFRNGRLDGRVVVSFSRSTTIDASFRAGQRHGAFITTGTARTMATYRNGILHGPWSSDEGWVKTTGQYHRGLRSETWIVKFKNGYSRQVTYAAGIEHGRQVRRDKHNSIIEAGTMARGKRVGQWMITQRKVRRRAYFHRGELVRVTPAPPAYRWLPVRVELGAGGVFGGTNRAARVRANADWIRGRATSRDGVHAGGGFVGLGGEAAWTAPRVDGAWGTNRASLGFSAQVGWAWDAYAPASRVPDTSIYTRGTAFRDVAGGDGWGLRLGVGVTSPRSTRAVFRRLRKRPYRSHGPDADPPDHTLEDAAGYLLAFLLTPVWSINHIEVSAEFRPGTKVVDGYGLLFGWGY